MWNHDDTLQMLSQGQSTSSLNIGHAVVGITFRCDRSQKKVRLSVRGEVVEGLGCGLGLGLRLGLALGLGSGLDELKPERQTGF